MSSPAAREHAHAAVLRARSGRGCRPISIPPRSPRCREPAQSPSSIGCASITGRKVGAAGVGRSAPCLRARRTAPCRRGEPVPDLLDLRHDRPSRRCARPVLASRAETPTRSAPLSNLISAKRPLMSSWSSSVSSSRGKAGRRRAQPVHHGAEPQGAIAFASGHSSETVSAVSPT